MPRWWLIPLAVAVLADGALLVRYEMSPGMTVNRAVVRGTSGSGGCERTTLVRSDQADNMFVIDTWTQGANLLSVAANPEFAPGGGIAPQSQQIISEGLDIEKQPVQPASAIGAKAPRAKTPLLASYLGQMRQGQDWLSGECVPFANPMRSHLRRLGVLDTPGGRYTVYRGRLTTKGGLDRFPKSEVWEALLPDGRVGFELLWQLPAAGANLSIVFVANLFTYPGDRLSALAQQPAAQRTAFYNQDYAALVQTVDAARALGPPAPALPLPSGVPSVAGG